MRRLIRSLLASLPPLLIYFVALPWAALRLDHRFALVWRLPFWMEPVAAVLVLAGAALGIWSFWALTFRGDGTPNPLAPTVRLVDSGPFRRSRNPLMLGGWLCGVGLACLLRSPCLLAIVGIIAMAGMFYVRRLEEPGLAARFGNAWMRYASRTPRWIALLLVVAATVAAVPAVSVDRPAPPALTQPAVLVQIRCKPGTAYQWRAAFDQHVKPAIDEVIARGDTFTDFQFIEAALPWQSFDFVLLYTGKTFAGLDRPSPFPHYVALFQREGSLRALTALKEMGSYEDQVTVTLVHLSRAR
ncbi:MAG: isoprenylcysteine carboxylmethyltransferase family protein [Bryobacteraceae bacterium]|jgi:protein-S-isoprenylcysteine O-methyltransferase Ste14